MSVSPERLGSHWREFHEIWYLSIFRKSVEKIQVSLKPDKNNRYFTWRPVVKLWYLAQFFLKWENFQSKFVEKFKTHFIFNNFSWKSCPLWDNWKNIDPNSPQITVWRMRFTCWTAKATSTEYVTPIVFPTATLVTRKHRNVTLYLHCLSC